MTTLLTPHEYYVFSLIVLTVLIVFDLMAFFFPMLHAFRVLRVQLEQEDLEVCRSVIL